MSSMGRCRAANSQMALAPARLSTKSQAAKRDVYKRQEVVYCGFGEPTLRLEVLLEVAAWLRERAPHLMQRLNTNGLANLQSCLLYTSRCV